MQGEQKLQVLVEQWKEINGFINKLDTELWVVFTILGSVYGVVITVFDGNLQPTKVADGRFWMLVFLPLISAAIMGCMANNFRWVAIARRYASTLEAEINTCLGREMFTWNLHMIDNYVEKNNLHNSHIMPIIIVFFFVAISAYLAVSMWASPFDIAYKCIYIIAVVALFCGSMFSLLLNGKVRKNELFDDCFGKKIVFPNK